MMLSDWAASPREVLDFKTPLPSIPKAAVYRGDDPCPATFEGWQCSRHPDHSRRTRHAATLDDGTVVAVWSSTEPTA